MLEDPGITPDDYAIDVSLRSDLDRIMAILTPQQQQIITLRFGLKDAQSLTLAKIGDLLNMSRERVRQLEREAIGKLRRYKSDLGEYLVS